MASVLGRGVYESMLAAVSSIQVDVAIEEFMVPDLYMASSLALGSFAVSLI